VGVGVGEVLVDKMARCPDCGCGFLGAGRYACGAYVGLGNLDGPNVSCEIIQGLKLEQRRRGQMIREVNQKLHEKGIELRYLRKEIWRLKKETQND
jgi:hypothetical protein